MLGTNCFAVISLRVGRYKVGLHWRPRKFHLCVNHVQISDQIPRRFMIFSLTRWPCSPSSLLAFAAVGSPLLTGHLPSRLPSHFAHPSSSCSLWLVLHLRLPPQFCSSITMMLFMVVVSLPYYISNFLTWAMFNRLQMTDPI